MNVNIRKISGVWDLGYSLDKHSISSVPNGYYENGRVKYNTLRTDAGEALYQLKYRSDFNQVPEIALELYQSLDSFFPSISAVVPMLASKNRIRQPVTEIAKEYARLRGLPCLENLLIKTVPTAAMKDIVSREEKLAMLINSFRFNDVLGSGIYDILIIDDLFDTGSSLEAATKVLRSYRKIRHVYVMTVTRKR